MPEYSRPRHIESVAELCDATVALVAAEGWSEDDQTRVALVMGEALANAVEHGTGPDGWFRVRVDLIGPVLDVCVADGGVGPAPAQLATAQLPDDPFATEGRGLFILKTVADQVRVDDGTLCVTVCARP